MKFLKKWLFQGALGLLTVAAAIKLGIEFINGFLGGAPYFAGEPMAAVLWIILAISTVIFLVSAIRCWRNIGVVPAVTFCSLLISGAATLLMFNYSTLDPQGTSQPVQSYAPILDYLMWLTPAWALFPAFLLYLSLTYPRPHKIASRKPWIVYLGFLLLGVIAILELTSHILDMPALRRISSGPLGMGVYLGCLVAALWFLFKRSLSEKSRYEGNRLFLVFFAVVGGVSPLILGTLVETFVPLSEIVWLFLFACLLILPGLLSLAASPSTPPDQAVVKKGFVRGILLAAVCVALFTAAEAFLVPILKGITTSRVSSQLTERVFEIEGVRAPRMSTSADWPAIAPLFVVILAVFPLSWLLKRYLPDQLSRGRKSMSTGVRKEELPGDLPSFRQYALNSVSTEVDLDAVYLFWLSGDRFELFDTKGKGSVNPERISLSFDKNGAFARSLAEAVSAWDYFEHRNRAEWSDEERETWRQSGIEVALPLRNMGQLEGILGLGGKASGVYFKSMEKEALFRLALRLSENLSQIPRSAEEDGSLDPESTSEPDLELTPEPVLEPDVDSTPDSAFMDALLDADPQPVMDSKPVEQAEPKTEVDIAAPPLTPTETEHEVVSDSFLEEALEEVTSTEETPPVAQQDDRALFAPPDTAQDQASGDMPSAEGEINLEELLDSFVTALDESKQVELEQTQPPPAPPAPTEAAVSPPVEEPKETPSAESQTDMEELVAPVEGLKPGAYRLIRFPAREVGGNQQLGYAGFCIRINTTDRDFFDYWYDAPTSSLHLVVGNVRLEQGKGRVSIESLVPLLRDAGKNCSSPLVWMSRLRESLRNRSEVPRPRSLAFVTLNASLGDCRFMLAGDAGLIQYSPRTRGLRAYSGGVLPDPEAGSGAVMDAMETRVPLARRALYMLFTEGIPNTLSPEGEPYGEDRLARMLRDSSSKNANEIRDGAQQALNDYSGSAPPTEDRTLCVVQIS